jgi:hypothetical protein
VTTRVGLGQVERTDRLVWTCAVHLIGKLHSKLRMLDVVQSHWPELEGMMQELSGAAEAVTGMHPPRPPPPLPAQPARAARGRALATGTYARRRGRRRGEAFSDGRGAFQEVYAFHCGADYDGCAPRPPALPCRARALACRGDGLLSPAALAMPAAGAEPAGRQARS